jgi:hypothetical protein
MSHKAKLKLKQPGDKSVSVHMEWIVQGTDYTIVRHVPNGSVNSSAANQRRINWYVSGPNEEIISVPANIHKHEASIARWLLSARKDAHEKD